MHNNFPFNTNDPRTTAIIKVNEGGREGVDGKRYHCARLRASE